MGLFGTGGMGKGLRSISDIKDKKMANEKIAILEDEVKKAMMLSEENAEKMANELISMKNLTLTEEQKNMVKKRLEIFMGELEYQKEFPAPEKLQNHKAENHPSFYFQVLLLTPTLAGFGYDLRLRSVSEKTIYFHFSIF